ncbi:colicin immunity domain-containing protein [Moraxella sp. ZY200743]|uniref:colicin immunity domain-containing protein n=1 Tax=Moraxella sp. ZY200743 TaxID=2911970 RepID=UPI003D7EFDB0
MTTLLKLASDFHQGKYQAEEFMMKYLEAWRTPRKETVTDEQATAGWHIFSACDRFAPDLGLDGIDDDPDININETQFRKEVEQTLKSVGLIKP